MSESLFSRFRRGISGSAERNARLSDDEIARYRTDGFVIPGYRVPEEILSDLQGKFSEALPADPDATPDRFPHILRNPVLADAINGLARQPGILNLVAQLMGGDIALWGAGIFGKPPLRGKETPWHQDAAFVEFQAIRPLELCTVWLAFDGSTPENGCVRFIAGSHSSRTIYPHVQREAEDLTLDYMVQNQDWDESRIKNAILARGQISIHDVFLIHGSESNRSGKRRAGIVLRYMPTTSCYDHDFARQHGAPDRTIYLVRGIDRSGTNKLAAGTPA